MTIQELLVKEGRWKTVHGPGWQNKGGAGTFVYIVDPAVQQFYQSTDATCGTGFATTTCTWGRK